MSNAATIEDMIDGITINLGSKENIYTTPAPKIDLLLALPRPQKLEKLLPIISCLGVRNIFLVDACKVEKDYFGKVEYNEICILYRIQQYEMHVMYIVYMYCMRTVLLLLFSIYDYVR